MSIFRRMMLSGGLNIDIDSLPETQKIYYTATAKVTPKSGTIGTVLVNNYNNETSQGVMCFNSEVIKIGDSAFESNKALNSIIIPNSVTTIGNYVFRDCSSLTSVTIPNSIKTLEDNVFTNTKNVRFNITDLSAWCQINRPYITNYGYMSTIFLNGLEVVELLIPDDVTEISARSFTGFSSVQSVTIPNNVELIGAEAFSGCTNLKDVIIGDGVTTIKYSAFYNSKIRRVKIGKNVRNIEYDAFNTAYPSDFDFSSHNSIPNISKDTFSAPSLWSYNIIVPDLLYEQWIIDPNWTIYAERIIKKSDWDAQQVTE